MAIGEKDQPNLLLIMTDQFRADLLKQYGGDFVKTPRLDQLSEEGVTFERAYSQTPVCIPARHGLISGKHPFEVGLMENKRERKEINNPLPRLIRDAGYFTCAVGKMHFIPTREHFGFDRMFLSEGIPSHIQDDDYLQYLRRNGYAELFEPYGERSEKYYVPQVSPLPEEHHVTTWTADKSIETICRNSNRNFFLFSSFNNPHPPFDPVEPYDGLYPLDDVPLPTLKESELKPDDRLIEIQNDYKVGGIENISERWVKKIRSYYYGSVTQLDKHIGRLLDFLKSEELRRNTLIVFTADHGELLGDHYAFGKRTFYEESTRIPLILSWPGHLPKGKKSEAFVLLQDIYATLLSRTGSKLPSDCRGKDLVELIEKDTEKARGEIFGEYGSGKNIKLMVRWKNYKYIYHSNGQRENLYHLEKDPGELEDIAEGNPELCKKCRSKLVERYKNYSFDKVLSGGGNELIKFDYEAPEKGGFLDQSPDWPDTKIDDCPEVK